jgi:transcriptional regulator with XRE-family HTH domain
VGLGLNMTHFQDIFIENLRFWRKKRGISQLKLSEMVNISPNYLNAVENGKNFPSPEVIQNISDTLEILPYQLFLENPAEEIPVNLIASDLVAVKQRLIMEIDTLIQKCEKGD